MAENIPQDSEDRGDHDAILVVEDDPRSASVLQESLETEGYPVIVTHTGQEALSVLRERLIALVLLDLRLPDLPGITVLQEVRQIASPPDVVIVTGHGALDSALAAIEAGAAGYLLKPVELPRLRALVAKLFAERRLRRENATLLERIERERGRFQVLYDVSRGLASLRDTDQILALIVNEASRVLRSEAAALRLREGEELVLRAHRESAAALTTRRRVTPQESLSGLVLAAGAPVLIEDLAEDTPYDPAHTRGIANCGFRGFLGVPLRSQGKIIGALNIYTTSPRSFSSDEVSLLSALADQAAVAIEATRLQEETGRRGQQLATLTDLTRVLTTVLDPPALAREILGAVQVLIPGAAGRLWEVAEDNASLRLVASLGLEESADKGRIRFAIGHGMIGIAAATGEPVISADVTRDPRFLDPAWATAEGLVACIVVPLNRGERVIGGLTIFTRIPHAFSQEEVGLLRSFADQAVIALGIARLFQREQERRRQLEAVRAATAEISRVLELKDLLRLISQRSTELLSANSGAVVLWDEAGQVLVPAAWHGHGEWFRAVRWKLGEGVAGTVAQRRRGLTVNDYRTSPFVHAVIGARSPITAVLAEPLLYRDRLLGVITVDSHDGQRTFTDADRHLLGLFAAQAAVAIENARLIEDVSAQRARLAQLFESAVEGIYQTTPEGAILFANPALARIFGFQSPDDLKASLPSIKTQLYVDPTRRAEFIRQLETCETVAGFESQIYRKDGRVIWLAENARAVRDAGGKLLYFEGFTQDITDRKQADQMKSDFVSFVTHQLRTPLAGIKWLLELAAEGPEVPEEVRSYIQDARESNERLIRLVNDLLDVSRLERGKLPIAPEEICLEKLTRSVLDELSPLIAEKGHRLSITGGSDVSPVWADPQLLRQVILNLTSNAIKYTLPGGEIAIRVSQEEAVVRWTIRDSGIGIPPEAQRRLFEKFYRAENVLTVDTEGTGLGLYLVRLILEQFGGRVWCESEEARGSTFLFTLPLREKEV